MYVIFYFCENNTAWFFSLSFGEGWGEAVRLQVFR